MLFSWNHLCGLVCMYVCVQQSGILKDMNASMDIVHGLWWDFENLEVILQNEAFVSWLYMRHEILNSLTQNERIWNNQAFFHCYPIVSRWSRFLYSVKVSQTWSKAGYPMVCDPGRRPNQVFLYKFMIWDLLGHLVSEWWSLCSVVIYAKHTSYYWAIP